MFISGYARFFDVQCLALMNSLLSPLLLRYDEVFRKTEKCDTTGIMDLIKIYR